MIILFSSIFHMYDEIHCRSLSHLLILHIGQNASDNPTLRVLYVHCPFPTGNLFSDALQLHDVKIRAASKSNGRN